MMRRYLNQVKRLEKQLEADTGQPAGIITQQAELIRQYLHDEITAEEFEEASLVKKRKLTPEQAEYQKNIFKKYLKEND